MSGNGNGSPKKLQFDQPPQRVISLVPSITESLFELGMGSSIVGITDFCLHPEKELMGLPRVGGPKNPRTEEILALRPDLVLANWEENTPQTVDLLEQAGVAVWVTFPKSVREALDVLWVLTAIYHSTTAAIKVDILEMTLDWAHTSNKDRTLKRYFCPIWTGDTPDGQKWWMTFNRDTYCHDLLEILGGDNIFANRCRRYPLSADLGIGETEPSGLRDIRYPRVTSTEVIDGKPDIILLPSEPFKYTEADREQLLSSLADTPAMQMGQVHFVDGSLITWHGTRLARALRELTGLFTVE